MIRNPVSFNEATHGHTRTAERGPRGGVIGYRCTGCSWSHQKTRGAEAFRKHLIAVWKSARDA